MHLFAILNFVFVDREELENTNCTFHDNDTITYIPRRKLHFDAELSVGNPATDRIMAPNIPLLVNKYAIPTHGLKLRVSKPPRDIFNPV